MKILIFYITGNSGHQRAALALEKALKGADPKVETRCVDAFIYTNPILERIIHKTYMAVIKRRPQVWERIYDNPEFARRTKRFKESLHRYNSGKMKKLLDDFEPDAVACTQAFPCGMVADIKKSSRLTLPLVGILTDYAPHLYWIYNEVDAYIVPSEETGAALAGNGVPVEKIKPLGIPVDPKFYSASARRESVLKRYSLDPKKPVLLIMGGGHGLGPIKNIVSLLDKSPLDIQAVIATGSNKRLYA